MSFNIIFSYHDQGSINNSTQAISTNRDLVRTDREYCVQLYQNTDFMPAIVKGQYWGVYFIPKGYKINYNLYAFYGLDIVELESDKTAPIIKAVTHGC